MKRTLHIIAGILLSYTTLAQITSPQIKANFGVDGELRANFFDGFVVNGNDDWFNNLAGTGKHIIDTTGASFILSKYSSDPNSRRIPFFRGMRYPQYSVVNGRLLLDGIFIRDHHGDDSTVFASGSNKNGMSPAIWSCPVSQGIPDKNDILDIMMHVRRAGASVTDSLWMFGGVSIDNTTGNRYFDFEMYQTDITYNRLTRTFNGFGPDAGHTAWQFDGSGNITKAGDIIFTAEYSSSQLSMLEARIWVHKDAVLSTPGDFNWGGSFDGDGAGATYGYANIVPKTAGAFYTGLQSSNNTWAGPFALVLQDNSVVANYSARQFMEFSVNLSKLGLDPLATQNNACGMPFRRILVKSRASTSFTAELKDFVGPFSFFRAPAAQASADIPMFCGSTGISNICLDSALATSLYTWATPNGNIVGDTVGTCITVDMPGTYIVRQQLMDSCGISYATDTVVITADPGCVLLTTYLSSWNGTILNNKVSLNWTITNAEQYARYEIERSFDKNNFTRQGSFQADPYKFSFQFSEDITGTKSAYVFYRLKIIGKNGSVQYSKIISFPLTRFLLSVQVAPNPVTQFLQLSVASETDHSAKVQIIDVTGRAVLSRQVNLKQGINSISFNQMNQFKQGVYQVQVHSESINASAKFILLR